MDVEDQVHLVDVENAVCGNVDCVVRLNNKNIIVVETKTTCRNLDFELTFQYFLQVIFSLYIILYNNFCLF